MLLQVLHGWAFDHWVLEPTRHCHHQGSVPVLSFAAGLAALGLTLGSLVAVFLARGGAPRTGGGCGRALLVLLLVGAVLLLAYDALALLADFAPGVHDPFHCGQ